MDNDAAGGAERGVSDGPSGDEAAWRDLVTRLEETAPADPALAPWPALEDVRPCPADPARRADEQPRIIRPATFLPGPAGLPGAYRGRAQDGSSGSQDEAPGPWFGGSGQDDQRYVRPPAPPLPALDPVTKGAWLALFGGPGYLFVATLLDWQVPGWAALAAIAAFVTGFVILVVRLGDGPSRRDDPDQGAVV